MRKLAIFFGLTLALLTGLLIWEKSIDNPTPVTQQTTIVQPVAKKSLAKPAPPTRTELLDLVNAERAKNGIVPLTEDPRLDQSAQMKADDMDKYGYFAHISPSESPYAGLHGYQLIDKVDLHCVAAGENLVEPVPFTATSAILRLINSPEHHAVMIDARYDLTGFGIVTGAVVEQFCQSN